MFDIATLGLNLGDNEKVCLVGGIRPYDYTKKDTGERKTGVSLHCIVFDPSLNRPERGEQGGKVEDLTIGMDAASSVLASGLGLYVASFSFYQWGNEWRRRLTGLRYVGPLKVSKP